MTASARRSQRTPDVGGQRPVLTEIQQPDIAPACGEDKSNEPHGVETGGHFHVGLVGIGPEPAELHPIMDNSWNSPPPLWRRQEDKSNDPYLPRYASRKSLRRAACVGPVSRRIRVPAHHPDVPDALADGASHSLHSCSDYCFWFGDLNYRVTDLDDDTVCMPLRTA